MTKSPDTANSISKPYFISVIVLTIVFPVVSFVIEYLFYDAVLAFETFSKWFIFSAVGLRLFIAGIRQSTNPAFTAKAIFHIDSTDSFPIVRELGFANICFGLVGIISLFKSDWRMASAFGSGLYYAFAALLHIIKKPASKNEQLALWSDLLICLLLAAYFVKVV